MRIKGISSILLFVVLSWLVGCTASPTPVQPTAELNIANPASVYCEKQGGEVDIRATEDGAVGYCVFSDGSECEEWAFFYGKCAPKETEIIGMPNPASVYCEEQGGQLEIRTEDAGEYGVCIFPDGSECEEWAFFRGECKPGESEIGMPNPASVYCEEQGGKLEIRTDADGGQYGVCIFEDGSECEEWAFFHGECAPGASDTQIANPASVYCEEQGGKLEIRTDADGGQYGVCIFEDGSECEEWAFFRGECKPAE